MPFAGSVYDPETLTLMTHALDAAWEELLADHPALDPVRTRTVNAFSIGVSRACCSVCPLPADADRAARYYRPRVLSEAQMLS